MVKLTFPRELRLLTPASFNFVFQQPLRAGSPFVTFVYRKNDLGYARLGFAVAKKQVKRAHERNRIKRLVRESFRLNQHSLPAVDLIVMARTAAVDLDNKQLMEQVDKLWQRIKRNSQNPSAQST